MWKRVVVARFEFGIADIGMVHRQRSENVLANVIVPGSAGYGGNDLSGGHIKQIVVSVVAAETRLRLHKSQLVNHVLARIRSVRPEQKIALAQSHAAAMREQIADSHLVRDVGVVHDEADR